MPLPQVIVFCVFKKQAKALGKWLAAKGFSVAALHGDLSQGARPTLTLTPTPAPDPNPDPKPDANLGQGARDHALKRFRAAEARILVATDVAARGLDVPNVSVVITEPHPKPQTQS